MPSLDQLGEVLDGGRLRRVVLALFGSLALLTLRTGSPLGWDESVYAARAKDLARSNFDWSQTTSAYWSDLRAPGFPAILAGAFELFGESDFVARALVVGFSVAFLAVLAKTLDFVAPPRAGTSAIIIAATCPGFFATSTLAFADHPAAFFASLSTFFLLRAHVTRDTSGLVLVPMSIAIATTIRFGAVLLVAPALGFIALAVLRRALGDRNWRNLVPFVIAGLVTVGVVASLLTTTVLTRVSSPVNAKDAQVAGAGNLADNWISDLREILSPGAVDYGFGGAFWGWSYSLVFGMLLAVVVIRLLISQRLFVLLMMSTISLAPVVLYGVSVRQFVTTYLAPEFAIGAAMVAWAIWLDSEQEIVEPDGEDLAAQSATDGSRALVAVGVVVVAFVGWRTFVGVEAMHDRLWGFEQVRAASVIADDVLGQDCRLFTARVPQAAWYSECNAVGFSGAFQPDDGELWADYVEAQASRVNLATDPSLGFLLLEGLSGQPAIDDVWVHRQRDHSIVLRSPGGRRVALVGIAPP